MTLIFVNQAGDGGGGTQLQFYEAGDAFWKDLRYIPLLLTGIFSFSQLTHAVCSRFKPLAPARFHVTILCSILAIYAYRDIWPLANYGSVPKDQAEGNILWVKIALLVVTGVIIPLFIPHPYVPVDPKNPSPVPNPEQTASWISALTYTYADPIIILANKVAHLRHDQLPPLSDYDFAQYLSESAAKYVDPFAGAKRRHLFFGLLSFFREFEANPFSELL
ncbi:hypothetical protein JR316_0007373 [Psilocybe cubensis]|uniref:Uncharacterized protein n=1 Tax=Psilocybe cubensis TaxID=181762 RepID=A0ACB8GYQ7_PSICU|nr:hypothetical protein JR316_0007373 [Psilocybe cubensis]KAH9480773.1 hypothetical protein JR316_0007373 [Psilocybe cubensis]